MKTKKYTITRLFFIAAVFSMIFLCLTGCGGSKSNRSSSSPAKAEDESISEIPSETSSDETSVSPAEEETSNTESIPETTSYNVHAADSSERFTVDLNALLQISNDGINWGPGSVFDQYNRPEYAVNAQNQYQQYDAYFLMPIENKLYLTMDCGSSSTYASQILDTLKEKSVHVTFFVTMPFVENNPDIVKRMVEEGHSIGNHSVTHPASGMFTLSVDDQINEVKTVHDKLLNDYGYNMHLFRYPQGTYSIQSLALMQQLGYKSVFWSFAYVDYDQSNQPDRDYAIQKLTDRIHPGAIYLLHIDSETNSAILSEFIDIVHSKGYTFGYIE